MQQTAPHRLRKMIALASRLGLRNVIALASRLGLRKVFALAISLVLFLLLFAPAPEAEARRRSKHAASTRHTTSTRHARSHRRVSSSTRHRTRHHRVSRHHRHHHVHKAAKPKYAYPLELFMHYPPEFDRTPLPTEMATKVRHEFERGIADRYHPNELVRAGIVEYHPLRGGIFKRREQVKYIILHSTETGPPVSARSVIDAWSSLGRRHAGAQYVVERDGTIYQSCEPDLATVHVNIFKTLPGINNDNSIGIEMNHTGRQTYPAEQREAVKKLMSYLQDRYHVLNENIITHRYAQQGDHTDPVSFDFEGFLAWKDDFHNKALAMKRELGPSEVADIVAPTATVFLEMHKEVKGELKEEATPAENTAPSVQREYRDTALTPKDSDVVPLPKLRTEIELAPDSAYTDQPAQQQTQQPNQVP